MGSGSFTKDSFMEYSRGVGKLYSMDTGRVSNQVFKEVKLNQRLSPRNIMRECVDDEEHPNTVPIILGLDVTGSMGGACQETAEALGVIMQDLFKEYENSDVNLEFCMMGIGDLECDAAPIQMGQFESDVRIAQDLDAIYMEHGGGSNPYESYTAAWYMASRHTDLDAIKKGRKGIVITMGDEPLNPILFADDVNKVTGDSLQKDVKTKDLYKEASSNFDIYHIDIDHARRGRDYSESWISVIGDNYKVSTINGLKDTIENCIKTSISGFKNTGRIVESNSGSSSNGMPEISW